MKKLLIGALLSCSLLFSANILGDNTAEAATGQTVSNIADDYIGVPYRWGGTTPSGFDCSGFVGYTYKQAGYTLPRTTSEMYHVGDSVSKSELKDGDLVFFQTYKSGPSHAGIYIGDNQFVHASSTNGVRIDSLSSSYWSRTYYGAKRVLSAEPGWSESNGNWYYYDQDGNTRTGWVQDSGAWYYFNPSGVMQTGWLDWNDEKYYLHSGGSMAVGWTQIDGQWYYFYEDGVMAKDAVIEGYTIASNGIMQ